jgi:hypothetical protein
MSTAPAVEAPVPAGRSATLAWSLVCAAAFVALRWLHPWPDHLASFLVTFVVAWIACAGVARSTMPVSALLLGALLWRVLFVTLPPTLSDDIYRYVWEGQIQWHGWNPFVHAPASEALRGLRNELWSAINHPSATAIYPPLTQVIFKGLAALCGVTGFKVFFCLIDLLIVAVLARGLERRGMPTGRLALYAWNPLVVVEVAASGHFEPLALLPLVAGIHWLARRRRAAWLALAGSIGIKYAAVVLVVPFWRRARLPLAAAAGAMLLWGLSFLPYRNAGGALFDSLLLYADTWRYNDMLFRLLVGLCGSLTVAKLVAAGLLGLVVVVVSRRSMTLEAQCLVILAALVFLSPTIHPWYLLWFAVLLPWVPSRALFAWTGSVVVAYLFLFPLRNAQTGTATVEQGSVLLRLLQMLPVAAGAWLDVRAWRRGRTASTATITRDVVPEAIAPGHIVRPVASAGDADDAHPPTPPHPHTARPRTGRVALMMPALDEERSLPLVFADLEALQKDQAVLDEIIVVDNGSSDATRDIALRAGATVLEEPRRGYGAACLCALAHLESDPPEFLVFMDADRSDDAAQIPELLRPLRENAMDLVIGSRTRGTAEPGALLPQARFGNWLATGLIRWRTGFRYTDLGPFRAVRFDALQRLGMTDRDFGWTVEMQMRALQHGLRVCEVPVRYRRRVGRSKISGTLGGSLRAGVKILATLWRLRSA